MASRPTVDVVIPCFNGERFIGEAIESVLTQRGAATRAIVVDDGSADDSVRVIEGFGIRVRLVKGPHRGAAAARNIGVALAEAEFLGFLDADDLWTGAALADRLDGFATDVAVDVVFGEVEQFLNADPGEAQLVRRTVAEGPVAARLAGTMLLRLDSFRRVGPFDESRGAAEAIDWVARADAAGLRFKHVPRVVLRRRIHDDNLGVREGFRQADYLRVLKAAIDRRHDVPR